MNIFAGAEKYALIDEDDKLTDALLEWSTIRCQTFDDLLSFILVSEWKASFMTVDR